MPLGVWNIFVSSGVSMTLFTPFLSNKVIKGSGRILQLTL